MESSFLNAESKQRFLSLFRNRITLAGVLVIACDAYRDQKRNADTCLEKLTEMILAAQIRPKKRRATLPTRGSQIRRQNEKILQKHKKRERRTAHDE